MNSIARLAATAVGLVLVLTTTPSWGQPVLNPTVSDANGNTAGGTNALVTCLGKTAAPCSSMGRLRQSEYSFMQPAERLAVIGVFLSEARAAR